MCLTAPRPSCQMSCVQSNGKFAENQAKNIKEKYSSYLEKMPVSTFLGAAPLH